jgi:O-antigen/teichoic acid export membrane protein
VKNTVLSSLLSISWQSIAYGIGVFGRQIVVFLMLPLLTRFLSTTEFGIISIMLAFVSFIDVLSDAGLPAATYRLYNDKLDQKGRRDVLGSSLVLFVLFALLMAVITWAGASQISQWLLKSAKHTAIVRIASLTVVTMTLLSFGQLMLRIQVRPFANSLQQVLIILVQNALALYLVMRLHLGASGYWLGQFIGGLIGLLLFLWLLRHTLQFSISSAKTKELVIYALPMIPTTLSVWALSLIDRSLISSLLGLQEVAVYDVGYRIGALVASATVPFQVAWPQFAFSIMRREDAPQIYRNITTFLATGCTLVALGIITFSEELVRLLASEQYLGAIPVVRIVALSQIAWGLFPVLSIGSKISKRTADIAIVTCIAALSNIFLNLVLLPSMGINGAAVATLVAYLLLVVLTRIIGRRSYRFPLDYLRFGKLASAAAVTLMLMFSLQLSALSSWFSIGVRTLCLLTFPLILLALRFIPLDQAGLIWSETRNLFHAKTKQTFHGVPDETI